MNKQIDKQFIFLKSIKYGKFGSTKNDNLLLIGKIPSGTLILFHINGDQIEYNFNKQKNLILDYKQLDSNQFILTYGKDPFRLNNFRDDILLEFKTRIENEFR